MTTLEAVPIALPSGQTLEGDLVVPAGATGVVLFAHGSGSSRHSPRNRAVAEALNRAGLATLLLDLLTPEEERAERETGHLRFNIGLLAERLTRAIDWLATERETATLSLGLFGASTGGGAALAAAARRPERVRAVVSRGGRPDLAGESLPLVSAPTLLLVGERDETVVALNRKAATRMIGARSLRVETVPGATHLFEEAGALEEVARRAAAWFGRYLLPAEDLTPFADRAEAGRALAARLSSWRGRDDLLVLALPRGGVPVAFEVARALGAPLDVLLVRKLGVPGQEEWAMGAIASGEVLVMNEDVVRSLRLPREEVAAVEERERRELRRRERAYRDDRPFPRVAGKTVILIDDGLATGASMRAAARAVRAMHPARLVLAVPVAAPEACDALASEADEIVCARTPEPFVAVGCWYRDFRETADTEVRALLEQARPDTKGATYNGDATTA